MSSHALPDLVRFYGLAALSADLVYRWMTTAIGAATSIYRYFDYIHAVGAREVESEPGQRRAPLGIPLWQQDARLLGSLFRSLFCRQRHPFLPLDEERVIKCE